MADNTAVASEAASKPTGVKIRCAYFNDTFTVDDKTTVTGDFQEFSATAAKKIEEAAQQARVQLVIDGK